MHLHELVWRMQLRLHRSGEVKSKSNKNAVGFQGSQVSITNKNESIYIVVMVYIQPWCGIQAPRCRLHLAMPSLALSKCHYAFVSARTYTLNPVYSALKEEIFLALIPLGSEHIITKQGNRSMEMPYFRISMPDACLHSFAMMLPRSWYK